MSLPNRWNVLFCNNYTSIIVIFLWFAQPMFRLNLSLKQKKNYTIAITSVWKNFRTKVSKKKKFNLNLIRLFFFKFSAIKYAMKKIIP